MTTNNRKDAVIVDAIRTPMAKSKEGMYRFVRSEELSAHLMRSILARNPKLNPGEIADIIWGCVQQTLEQCYNIGETLSSSPIFLNMFRLQTINRLCGSSMTALHMATQGIWSEEVRFIWWAVWSIWGMCR